MTFRVAVIFLTAIALTGIAFIADGLYIKAKAEASQVLLQRSFDAKLNGQGDGRPWPWADFKVAAEISAPRLAEREVVIAGASGQALAFGPAWLNNSSLPGDPGTAVIAAHRDTHFAWLKDIRPGDILAVERTDGRRFLFRATSARVAPWNKNGINVAASGHHLALATCWPFDATKRGPLRYIVDATLVSSPGTAIALR